MIISKSKGVIYVAVPKTGSQSLSLLLERRLKAADECPYEAEAMHDFHASLAEAKEITPLPLQNYWSFAFVRNPYDRFISYCAGHVNNFHVDPANAIALALEQAQQGRNRWLLPQSYFLHGVRKVYRYEQMNEALADLSKRLELDLSDLPRINVSEREPYAGYYDDALREAVGEVYRSDLLNLDYEF